MIITSHMQKIIQIYFYLPATAVGDIEIATVRRHTFLFMR
jgi:hypothetical protein